MKFDAIEMARWVFNSRDGIIRAAYGFKADGKADDMIAVTIPDLQARRQAAKKRGVPLAFKSGRAVLAALRADHIPAERMRHPLHAVANSEYGQAEPQNLCVANGRTFVVDGTRSSG